MLHKIHEALRVRLSTNLFTHIPAGKRTKPEPAHTILSRGAPSLRNRKQYKIRIKIIIILCQILIPIFDQEINIVLVLSSAGCAAFNIVLALAVPRLASPFAYPALVAPRLARHLLHCIFSCQRISVQTIAFCRDYFLGISEKYTFSMSIFGVFVF